MSGTRHLSTNKGKRVRLHLRNGNKVDGYFVKQEEEWVYLEVTNGPVEKFRCAKIRAMTINPH